MEIDHHMLEKYWSGRCTPEERTAVEAWMAGDVPDRAYELHAPEGKDTLKAQLWQHIQYNRSSQPDQSESKPTKTQRGRLRRWLVPVGIAASLFIVAFFHLVERTVNDGSDRLSTAEYREVQVPYGRKMQVILPDSSTVHLNAGTTFKYPTRFNGKQRHVLLEGEGFFEVTQNPNQPFIVETPYTIARVLGTRFNIRSRDTDHSSLTVAEGKVQFTAPGCADTLILTPNRQGIFNGKAMNQSEVNSRNYTAWTSGEIIFNGILLAEALPELERWYDVRITLENPELADYRVKASFVQASLSSVLHDLGFSMNINYRIKDKEVVLYR